MLADLALGQIIPVSLISAAIGYAGQAGVAAIVTRGARTEKKIQADVDKAKHSDSLVIEVVALARAEVKAVRNEMGILRETVDKLRPLEANFYELEQALDHLDALLTQNPEERVIAERGATAFVKRMRRGAEARGTLINEAQRLLSGLSVAEDHVGIRDGG